MNRVRKKKSYEQMMKVDMVKYNSISNGLNVNNERKKTIRGDLSIIIIRKGFKKTEESVTTFYLGLPPTNCDSSQVRKKNVFFLFL